MTSFAYYVKQIGIHVHIRVFAGPDEEHRACLGVLAMRYDEWRDFYDRIKGPGHVVILEHGRTSELTVGPE